MDLSPSYGGSDLNSLARSANEEFLGSVAGIVTSLIAFCRKTELPVYIRFAMTLEDVRNASDLLEEDNPPSMPNSCASLTAVQEAATRAASVLSMPTDEELTPATQHIRGHDVVEVPGKWNRHWDAPPTPLFYPSP